LLLASTFPAHAEVRTPTAQPLANPGVVQTSTGFTVLGTGSWKNISIATAPEAKGPYTVTTGKLLTTPAKWMSSSTAKKVWAPSVANIGGSFYTYYSAVYKGKASARCIGTGVSASPSGPFVPYDQPLACWKGTKAYDAIKSEGANFSLIDPTPAYVGNQWVLTYKTQIKKSGKWHTTTRMLALDPAAPWKNAANPVHADGRSIKLTDERNKLIEENPVMVEHGGKFTLFTSWGWFGTDNYQTRHRQNGDLWRGWLKRKPTVLKFTVKRNTDGFGNAQVTRDLAGGWLIFFNGHIKGDGKGPKGLYVGEIGWKKGKPQVTKLY
jgi:hypothetical protein